MVLATSETQSPMPCVWAAAAELLHELTAAVTTSPWLVVLECDVSFEDSVVASSEVDSSEELVELVDSTLRTVWFWWLVYRKRSATSETAKAGR